MEEPLEYLKKFRNQLTQQEWEREIMGPRDNWVKASDSVDVKALFVGTNILGYEHGQYYDLIMEPERYGSLLIRRATGNGLIRYDSIGAFFRKWVNVTGVSHAAPFEAKGANTDFHIIESIWKKT